jgi:hypothetical protein
VSCRNAGIKSRSRHTTSKSFDRCSKMLPNSDMKSSDRQCCGVKCPKSGEQKQGCLRAQSIRQANLFDQAGMASLLPPESLLPVPSVAEGEFQSHSSIPGMVCPFRCEMGSDEHRCQEGGSRISVRRWAVRTTVSHA